MGGFFGTVSRVGCVTDLFYGTDYNSHLGQNGAVLRVIVKSKVLSVPFITWKVHISVPSLNPIWINLKEMPE